MTFGIFLVAAIGYALIYTATPNRTILRERTRARTRRLLVTGAAILLLSAVLGAIELGPVIGPIVTCAAAVAAGSLLVLIGPFLIRETERA